MGKGRKETLDRGPFVYDTQGDKKEGRKIEIAQAKKYQDHLQAKSPIRVVAVGEQRRFLMSGASSEAVNGSMAPTSKKQRRQATSWRCRNRKKRMPESRGALARLMTLMNNCCV